MMATAFDKAGWKLLLFPIQEGSGIEPSINEILHYRLDALVLLSVNLTSTLADECRNARVPVVLYNRTTASDEASSVTGENDVGARTIAAHLLAGGHHRFAFVAGTEGSSTNRAREVAFSSYLVKSGALPPLREQGYFDSHMAANAVRR
jgi:DNA-binding LacI/PurR family transcriptional regulator